jgi:hypothetical protein
MLLALPDRQADVRAVEQTQCQAFSFCIQLQLGNDQCTGAGEACGNMPTGWPSNHKCRVQLRPSTSAEAHQQHWAQSLQSNVDVLHSVSVDWRSGVRNPEKLLQLIHLHMRSLLPAL